MSSSTASRKTQQPKKSHANQHRHSWKDMAVRENAGQRLARLGNNGVADPKARDTIFCPGCKRNSEVDLNRDKKFQHVLRSWLFDHYHCTACDNNFHLAGLPLILFGSALLGFAVLLVGQVIRAQF